MLGKNDSAEERLRPSTRVLTEGSDPRLSVGSARPPVFRSSTYVFSTPEAAERAFNITAGRAQRYQKYPRLSITETDDLGIVNWLSSLL
jgi:methionine-gamma-lyase